MKLRKMTSAGMMDCKKALEEAEGDFQKAADIIREKGKLVAAKRADRETSEGAVKARINGNRGILVCLGCETDFVSRNSDFQGLAPWRRVLSTALTIREAASFQPMNSSIMAADRIIDPGLAIPRPSMSDATPCVTSKIPWPVSELMLPLGAMPTPPTCAANTSEM